MDSCVAISQSLSSERKSTESGNNKVSDLTSSKLQDNHNEIDDDYYNGNAVIGDVDGDDDDEDDYNDDNRSDDDNDDNNDGDEDDYNDDNRSDDDNDDNNDGDDDNDGDKYGIITITYDKIIDDRKPEQDHVKERILYCDSCIRRDADTPGSDIFVTCLCFDCGKYLCGNCSIKCIHAGHLIASPEDSESERGDFCRKIIEQLSPEDNESMITRMKRERFVCTGKVDVVDHYEIPYIQNITGMCYTKDGSKIALIDENKLRLFNGYNYKLTRVIYFSDEAYRVTEITYFDGKKVSYFAITFPYQGQIMLVDIERYDDPIVKCLKLDGKRRQLWPTDIVCTNDLFSIEEVIFCLNLIPGNSLDIQSLPGPVTADKHYSLSEFKLVVHKECGAYFISSKTNGYIKRITYDIFNKRHVHCKAFVSNPAVHSVICVDMKKNVFASIWDASHVNGIYKSDENLKLWKLCIPALEYIAGKSTLGMVYKDRLFLLTKSEDGRQYITIFQNEVSDRGYGEGSTL